MAAFPFRLSVQSLRGGQRLPVMPRTTGGYESLRQTAPPRSAEGDAMLLQGIEAARREQAQSPPQRQIGTPAGQVFSGQRARTPPQANAPEFGRIPEFDISAGSGIGFRRELLEPRWRAWFDAVKGAGVDELEGGFAPGETSVAGMQSLLPVEDPQGRLSASTTTGIQQAQMQRGQYAPLNVASSPGLNRLRLSLSDANFMPTLRARNRYAR